MKRSLKYLYAGIFGLQDAPRTRPSRRTARPRLEALEDRSLPAVSLTVPDANVNTSAKLEGVGQQAEGNIAVDPTEAEGKRLFAVSIQKGPDMTIPYGLYASYSTDGGVTWKGRVMANGKDKDGGGDFLPTGRGDPTAAFDKFGNLYVAYLAHTKVQEGVVTAVQDEAKTVKSAGAGWKTDQWKGYFLTVTTDGKPETQQIVSNTADTISVAVGLAKAAEKSDTSR